MKISIIGFITLLFATIVFAADYAKSLTILDSDQVLSSEQLKGKNFEVDKTVRNDGLVNHYVINTDYGSVNAEGTAKLDIVINELNALRIMEELERTEVFKDSLVSGVKGVGEGVAELVTSPIETSKDIIEGTGQFFSNIGEAFVSDDPAQDNAMKVALGYDVAKRQFAYEFGINPYTTYEPVVGRLGEISQAAVAGGLTPKLALASIDHGVAMAARVSGTMRGMQKLVRDNPPNKLREINFSKLQAMGITEELANAILNNYSYDPYEETLLVGELETMEIPGRELFVQRAELATNKSKALFYRSTIQMMANYHRSIKPAKSILKTAGVLHLERKDGGRVVLVPLDYVFWIPELQNKIDEFDNSLQQEASDISKEFWVTGKFDKKAKAELEKRGWVLQEKAGSIY